MYQKTAVGLACVVVALIMSSCRYGTPAVVPATQHLAEPVAAGSFIVEPRTFKPFKLVVTTGMSNPRLEGTFSASGARNDIEVTLLEETQFTNWQNRRNFEAVYESGRVTNATLNVELPANPATYYVVFSNRFSIFSNKAVVADVNLSYDRVNLSAESGRRGRSGYRRR
jgi:hypothetical protein